MANRMMTRAESQGARIWYSPSQTKWWMDHLVPRKAMERVAECPDAIHVTNAYDILSVPFIAELMKQADR